MPKLSLVQGTTSKTLKVKIYDGTSSTNGGLTGLVFNSSGLIASYIREGDATMTSITLVTATVGTYSSGGFKEVDSVKDPGLYEIGIPNACLSGSKSCVICLLGATNMTQTEIEIEITATNNQDSVSGGMTAVPISLTQAVPSSNTAQTVGDALNAARAEGFGKWIISGTTLSLYGGDGSTVVRTFTLDSSTSPTQRV